MSKKINLSGKLSEFDRTYLADRGKLPDEKAPEPVEDEGEVPEEDDDTEDDDDEDYPSMRLVDLRQEADRRGLDTTGNKAELVDRLTRDDRSE